MNEQTTVPDTPQEPDPNQTTLQSGPDAAHPPLKNGAGALIETRETSHKPPGSVYYTKVELNDPENPTRLDMIRAPGSGSPPEALRLLTHEIQEVARTIVTVFADDHELRKSLFNELHVTADTGLRGPNYNVEAGLDNLAEVKNRIADQFPSVRTRFWKKYGFYVLVCVICLLPLGGAVYLLSEWGGSLIPTRQSDGNYHPLVTLLIALFWIPVGTALGLFLEYAYRVDTVIPFERLQSINPARWDPIQRFVNTVMSGYVLASLIGIGLFQVGVSSVLLNEAFTTKPYLALVIGFVAGFSSPYVQDLINQARPVVRTNNAGGT
jgi:hypothetical protein